ncbi:MAG: ribulose phosphate epimerase [Cytophagaceae bacterium]|nr:ribulose phosphate epimerase [Cytophagaceae bacterium]
MPTTTSHQYFRLYKPFGYISQLLSNDLRQARKKKFLGALFDFPKGVMAVGRLDEKSEGLLLLTTDGKWSDYINRSGIEKEYYAQVDGPIQQSAIDQMARGVIIGINGQKYKTRPCEVGLVKEPPNFPDRGKKIRDERHGPAPWIRLVITEGKFRQIRKMTSAVGHPTLRLVRVRVGPYSLDGLPYGQVDKINSDAIISN